MQLLLVTFSARLKMLRKEKGLTQRQLGYKLNLTEGAIRAWEDCRAKPDIDRLIKLSELFECSTDFLLGLNDNRNEEYMSAIEKDSNKLNRLVNRIPNGRAMLENMIFFLSSADEDDIETIATSYFSIARILSEPLIEAYNLRDDFYMKQSFDLHRFFSCLLNMNIASNEIEENFRNIWTTSINDLFEQSLKYGDKDDIGLVYKLMKAYKVSTKQAPPIKDEP